MASLVVLLDSSRCCLGMVKRISFWIRRQGLQTYLNKQDICARLCQCYRHSLANSSGAAGDEGRLAIQAEELLDCGHCAGRCCEVFADLFDSLNCLIPNEVYVYVRSCLGKWMESEQDNNLPVEGHLVLHLHINSKADQPTHLPSIRLVFLKHSPSAPPGYCCVICFFLTYSC
jgi:hypothetical protein